ncbi:MAG: DHH family phosphoesterase, partial [Lachnospiraceae bacterium]|nr:DHH family phosphoesterase [Lachnospiraceae bacterium]
MQQLRDIVRDAKTIGIAGHINPDADAVGSCLSVCRFLKNNYPDREITVYLNRIPNIFKFLVGAEDIVQADENDREKVFDLFIALDCGDMKRLGPSGTYFKNAARTFCVDHHLSNDNFADDNYVVPEASSTCELICDLIDREDIDKEMAECLYTGIIGDTGVFQYSCTASKTMELAGYLMDLGIDYPRIVASTFYAKTFEQNKILGQALLKSRL